VQITISPKIERQRERERERATFQGGDVDAGRNSLGQNHYNHRKNSNIT
jgi:hypothetical protein